MEQGLFEGRRGSKRLKAIERQLEKVLSEFENDYENTPEMHFLQEKVRWEGTAELIFAMAMRNVHFTWDGVRDYGFLRLCMRWIEEENINTMTPKSVATMTRSILPESMCQELGEELSALEIF